MLKNNIRHLKRSTLALVVYYFSFLSNVHAGPCTLTNNSLVSQSTGDCLALHPPGAPADHFDSLILQYGGNGKLRVENDVSAGNGFAKIWNDITIEGTASSRSVLDILSISPSTFQEDGARKTITTGVLRLNNVDLEANVEFKFSQSNNEIYFTDSQVFWHTRDPIFQAGTDLTVYSVSGDNIWKGGPDADIASNTSFDITSGGSFEFFGVGSTSNTFNRTQFTGGVTFNVDNNSTLRFHESGIDLNQSTINVNNNSTLAFRTSGTYITADTLNLNDSSILYSGGDLRLDVDTANIHNGTLTIPYGHVNAKSLVFSGNSIASGDRSTEQLGAEVVRTKDNTPTTLTLNRLNQLKAETLLLTSNFEIDLNGSGLRMLTGSDTRMDGGTINVNNGGNFGVFGDFASGATGTINLHGGNVFIGETATLDLSSGLALDFSDPDSANSALEIGGKLIGSGTIAGSLGEIKILSDDTTKDVGILSPGTSASPFGSLTIGQKLSFGTSINIGNSQSLIDSGAFDGGYYDVDIGLTGGTTPVSDKIIYGDGDVDLTLIKSVRVDVADSSTASQLHQKSFRVIEAGSGAAGSIVMTGQDIATDLVIEEGPNVPILIDFFIDDDAAFSGDDVTIYAEEQSLFSLKKHPGVAARRNRQSVTNILPTVATNPTPPSSTPGNPQPPAQTPAQQQAQQNVFNALQTTTNSQAAPSFSSIHPEPISSQMTVQIEQADNMLNTVLAVNTLARDTEVDLQNYGSFFFGSSNSHPSGVWANINYIDGKVDGQGDLGNFDYYLTSYTFGNSFIHRDDYELGLFFGLSNESMTEHDQANVSFDSDAYHIGLYGGFRMNDRWDLVWGLGHAWLTTESSRSTTLGSISETAGAEYDSQLNYLGLRARYDTSWLEQVDSGAYIGLAYLRADQDAFSETNAPNLGMTIDRAIVSSGIISLGMEASRALNEFDSTHMRTELRYDYDVQADSNSEHDISASFNFDPSNTQSFVGQNRGPHSLTFALGVDHEFQEDWLLSLAGAYTRSSHGYEVGGDIVMNWYW